MVYVIVEVVVSPDSKIDGLRNRTGGRVIRQQVQLYMLSYRWSCHQTAGSMVYVIVQVIVLSDSRFNGIRYRTSGCVI